MPKPELVSKTAHENLLAIAKWKQDTPGETIALSPHGRLVFQTELSGEPHIVHIFLTLEWLERASPRDDGGRILQKPIATSDVQKIVVRPADREVQR